MLSEVNIEPMGLLSPTKAEQEYASLGCAY